MSKITRRDFLRLGSAAAAGILLGEKQADAETMAIENGAVMSNGAWDRAVIMISVDDGYVSLYDEVYRILLLERGLSFTSYIVTSYVGTAGYVTWQQIWEMYWNGVEIGNHSDRHLDYTGRSYTSIYNDINNAKSKFVKQGLVDTTAFAYPFGYSNSNVVKAVKAVGLTSGRGSYDYEDQFNYPSTFNQWWIESLSYRNNTKTGSFNQIKPYIDEAIAGRFALSIVLHKVYPGATGDYELPSVELQKTGDYLLQRQNEGLIEVKKVTNGVTKLLHYKDLQ